MFFRGRRLRLEQEREMYKRRLDILRGLDRKEESYVRALGLLTTVEDVLNLRDEKVKVLRGLGWNEEADKLEADTKMRRAWT